MTPFEHPFFTLTISGLLNSSKAVGKLLVEPKTLGWETLRKSFENGFENLGVVYTPLKCFPKDFWDKWELGWRKGSWRFSKKKTLVIMYSPGAI
jgi:hypothetical protein